MPEDITVDFEITDEDAKSDKKKIYRPLNKILPQVIKKLKEKEIWVPLTEIARIEVQGKLEPARHALLRAQIIHFLKRANKYKKVYFKINERSRTTFDKQMKKYGIYQPQMKEYRSLRIQIPTSLIHKEKKAWVYSFNEYFPEIKYRSSPKRPPPTGEEMYEILLDSIKRELVELERYRKLSIQFAKYLKDDVKLASKSPKIPYRSWLKDTPDKKDINGRYYYYHRFRSKVSPDEVAE